MFKKIENPVLYDAMSDIIEDIKERGGGDPTAEVSAAREIISEMGISDEDWSSLVARSLVAFQLEQGMGIPVNSSINMTMFTAFVLGAEYQKRLSLNSDIVPPEWTP